MLLFAGFVATEVLARSLKHLLRQPRPVDRCQALGVCDSHGMPSSHASCMAFAAGLRLLHVLLPGKAGSKQRAAGDAVVALARRLWAAAEVLALGALAALVALSRVHLGYHSTEQVLAGAALGLALAVAWHMRLAPALERLLAGLPHTLVGRLLLLQPPEPPAAKAAPSRTAC